MSIILRSYREVWRDVLRAEAGPDQVTRLPLRRYRELVESTDVERVEDTKAAVEVGIKEERGENDGSR